ncbi:MAG TPA: hypothetical protein VIX35_12670, partial [Vicinamibacterales bacterium]
LFLLMCVVALVGAFQAVYIERLLAAARQTTDAADRDTESAVIAIADYRAAEAGYLATGQQPSYWMTRADTLASAIGEVVTRERAATPSAQARASFDEAEGALEDLGKLDNRARALVKNDQRFVASDVIFMDSLQAADHVAQTLAAARESDRAAREEQVTRLSEVRLAAIGGSMAIGIIGSWILLARARSASAAEPAVAEPSSGRSLSLGPIQPMPSAAAPAPDMKDIRNVTDVNLTEAADLCVDLARVLDSRDVPALFERAARILGAQGLVLWVADTSGALLRPSLTHGYSEKVLARMSGLQMDGDNATSLAFRSMQAQIVGASSPAGSGALAVPLVTATGCVGVLSAEVRKGRPGSDTLSVAQMIAAQFSALVAPGDSTVQAQAN